MNDAQSDFVSIQNMVKEYKSLLESEPITEQDFLDLDATLTVSQSVKAQWEEDCTFIFQIGIFNLHFSSNILVELTLTFISRNSRKFRIILLLQTTHLG